MLAPAGYPHFFRYIGVVLTLNVDSLLAFVLLGVGPLYVAVVFFGCAEVLLGGVVLLVLGGVAVLLVLGGVVVFLVLGVVLVLFGVDVVLVTDRAAIHTDKLMAILEGKTLNTASMAIFSTAVKSALTVVTLR